MTDTTFFGEGLRSPERPRGTRVLGRPERPMLLPTGRASELTHIPSVPGNRGPEVKKVSLLPEIADVVTYHASAYGNDAYNAGVNTIEYLRLTGLFWLKTLGALWAFGQIKRFGYFAKRKWNEFTSPYNNY